MPPKKYAPRKGKKRAYRGRRAGANRSGGLIRAMKTPVVPDRMLLKFTYKDNINLTGTAAWSIKDFRLNSIYDPDTSIVNGHQPLGYDQWSTFYNQYRVYKTSMTARFNNNQNGQVQVGIVPFNDTQTLPYDDSVFEQPHAVSKTMSGQSGISSTTLRKTWTMPRLLGQSTIQYRSNTNVAAQYATNPLEQIYARIVCRQVNESANPAVTAVVEITYYVELFDREVMKISFPDGKDPSGDFSSNPSWIAPPGPTGPTS